MLDTIEELEEEAFLRGVPEHEIVIAKTATWGEKTPNNDPNDPDAGGVRFHIVGSARIRNVGTISVVHGF